MTTSNGFRLINGGWAWEIDAALRDGTTHISLVAPFVKLATVRRFINRRPDPTARLITRFNLNDFYQGVSDLDALELVIESGGQVRGLRGLHSKLFLFDKSIAIGGSANLSEAALFRNYEFGFVASDRTIVDQCQQYFDNLWDIDKSDLSLERLSEWRKIVQAARLNAAPSSPTLPDFGADAGKSAERSPFLGEPSSASDDRQHFVKFFGSGSNRADPNDLISLHVESGGCHWACTYGRRPRNVEDGARMFMARLTKRPNDIRIFGQAVGSKHRDGLDDASEAEIKARPWKIDWPYYVRVHEPEMLQGRLSDGVSLNELMARFGENAFMSTRRNAERGKGNTNPRRSLSLQPQIELTPEAAAWVSAALNRRFRESGMIDLSLSVFDRPPDVPTERI